MEDCGCQGTGEKSQCPSKDHMRLLKPATSPSQQSATSNRKIAVLTNDGLADQELFAQSSRMKTYRHCSDKNRSTVNPILSPQRPVYITRLKERVVTGEIETAILGDDEYGALQ
jgi:hypothetical protein